MKFFKLKKIILGIVLPLFWGTIYAQGLEFNIYESNKFPKTSFSIYDICEKIDCKNIFSLSYDLAIHDYTSFGYILRIYKSDKTPVYSFVFSYDNEIRSYLKFNIETKQSLVVDTLDNHLLGRKRWMPIKMKFFLDGDSALISIDQCLYKIKNIGLSSGNITGLLFGSSKFGEEVPSFAIRNLVISGNSDSLHIPLNENNGEIIHDSEGNNIGNVTNPIWLINQSYFWKLLYTYKSSKTSGYGYDSKNNQFIIFNRDSFLIFNPYLCKEEKYNINNFPMSLHLGTNFFNVKDSSLYIYEVANDIQGTTICSLSLLTGCCKSISNKHLSLQRHHHSTYFDDYEQKYYIFGGFGNRKYTNSFSIYDLSLDTWSEIPLKGGFVTPRFFSSLGKISSKSLLLFGGVGNDCGDQSVGRQFYYDLYKVNLKDSTIKLIGEYDTDKISNVPVRNLLVLEDTTCFYTLCYPLQVPHSYLQLYKYSLNNDKYEVLGDSIPMESMSILSNANLFYNDITHEFYCCTQEFDREGGDSSVIKIYTLTAPAVSKKALCYYESLGNYNVKIIVAGVILFFILIYIYWRIKRKKRITSNMVESIEKKQVINSILPCKNAIYLLGNFQVFDKKGKDITYLFSSKIKQLFLLILVNTITGKLVTSSYIYGILWPEKDYSCAKNIKGVTLNKLRKILNEIDGIELCYDNNQYYLKMPEIVFCDYRELVFLLKNRSSEVLNTWNDRNIEYFIKLMSRGKFLQSEEAIFDALKSEFENDIYNVVILVLEDLYET